MVCQFLITSVVKSIFFPAIHVGIVTLFIDFITFTLTDLNEVLLSNSLTKLKSLGESVSKYQLSHDKLQTVLVHPLSWTAILSFSPINVFTLSS